MFLTPRLVNSFLVIFSISSTAFAAEDTVYVSAFLRNKSAYLVDDYSERSQFETTLQIKLSQQWDNWSWLAIGRARNETELKAETTNEIELRELRIGGEYENISLHIGRQQIIWGKTDGLRLLDVVNPLDLREFVLVDYQENRIPVWSLVFEYFFSQNSLEFLFIPEVAFDEFPKPGDEFYIPLKIPDGLPVVIQDTVSPAYNIKNWEYGLKLSGNAGSLDYTLNALYGWSNTPVPFRQLMPGPILEITPRLTRERLYGGSADLPIGPTVLRFEFVYTPDAYREIETPDEVGDFVKQNVIRTALGLDWTPNNWLVSTQIFYEEVLSPNLLLSKEPSLTYATFLLQRKFFQDDLTLQLFYLQGVDNNDRWISPKISYQFSGNFVFQLGADIFSGDDDGIFGQYEDKSRITFGATWHIK